MNNSTHKKLARPVIIGLVGGVASGKTYIGTLLESHGALRIDADRLGHEVLQQPEVRDALRARWGAEIFNASGEVDRPALATQVFGDSAEATSERRALEAIVHPRIRSLAEQRISEARGKAEPLTAIVLDAPLLLEAGWEPLCDLILFIDTPEETRYERAKTRGWTRTQLQQREGSQLPVSEKRSRSTHIIDNSVHADVVGQIDRLWDEISRRIGT
jgi:dephospho-CoA kinase